MPRPRARRLLVAFFSIAALAGVVTAASTIGGPLPGPLPIFPVDNWWNLDISTAPVDPASAAYVNFIGPTKGMHPDFGGDVSTGSAQVYGFPYAVVDGTVTKRAVQFQYADESDGVNHATNQSVPFYPIPDEAITQAHWIEGGEPGNVAPGGDRHMLIVDRDHRHLYELYNLFYDGSQWHAGSGAFFDLNVNGRRPEGWTSADAAGLAILPGLVRYDEVFGAGEIAHAFRVTVRATNGFVYPASHTAGSNPAALPMGARLRLKASKNLAGFPPEVQKIFRAMQRYGLIVADNGSDLFVSGTYDTRWDNGVLNPAFSALKASDFEVIERGYHPSTPSPTSAPAITTHPTNQAVRVGQNAQFTVAASGNPAPSYQWQLSTNSGSSWMNLADNTTYSGALAATLTVANVTAALSGNQYRAVATNSVGAATSVAATLTTQLFLTPKRFLTDADGDGKNEIAVFRPSIGGWFIRNSSQNYSTGAASFSQWGLPGDVPIAADFDGDGKTELTVFRPPTGEWYIRYSAQNYNASTPGIYQWGLPGDVPIVGDFDGDGRPELTVFRPSGGGWFIRYSSQGYAVAAAKFYQWGLPGDVPIAGDFDGDGKTDLAVFRPSSGGWFIRYSSQGYAVATASVFQWGLPGDVPLAGDFDGDGKNEIAVFRPPTGEWFIRYSAQNYNVGSLGLYQWGLPGDVPLVADFDADGRTEIAVYRPATGEWFIRYSAQNYNGSFGLYQWGLPGDVAIHP